MIPFYVSFNVNVLYLFIIFILNHLLLEVRSFTPLGRFAHTSVLVENKLYFLGGVKDNAETSDEIFHLDVSKQFKASAPSWVEPTIKIPFRSSFANVAMSNINNEPTIYLLGGNNAATLLSTLDLNTSKWNRPYTKGKEPISRIGMVSAIDDSGKIYSYGGISNSLDAQYLDEMIILNTVDLSWSYGSKTDSPKDRLAFTATFLPKGAAIVYIGGVIVAPSGVKEVDISEIKLYNISTSIWTTEVLYVNNNC
jgi:hypothetical protein